MKTVDPIRNTEELNRFKDYYKIQKDNSRNYLLLITGLNTALRISDILTLKWSSVYDFENKCYKQHIYLTEKKTQKKTQIFINNNIREALSYHMKKLKESNKTVSANDFLFLSKKGSDAITRMQADRIIKEAAEFSQVAGLISCHSLRKTFGYQAWKQGVPLPVLVKIYNHSSYDITKLYLGIEQDDKDEVFKNIII